MILQTSRRGLIVGLIGALASAAGPTCSAAPLEAVAALARAEKPALINSLREFVEIESGSSDAEGINTLAERIAARLRNLGGAVEILPTGAEVYRMEDTPEQPGPVVQAVFRGTGARKILLLAHLDTVYARGTLARQPFRLEGNRAYGLGVADDKQGLATILHTLAILRALEFRGYDRLTVLCNSDEEISSPGSRALITRLGAEHDAVLSFEATRVESDKLSLATSGIASATLRVRGRGSHAGTAPERGVNALYELAHQILQLRDLSEPELGLKLSWTLARAGVVRNMIPPEATASADVRVLRVADYDRIEQKLAERIKNKLLPEAVVELKFERRRPPLEATPAARALARHAQEIYREIGRELVVNERPEGGGTDAAFAALKTKAPVVEGFGLQGYGGHSTDNEYVLLDSIEPRLYLATRLIMDFAAGKTP